MAGNGSFIITLQLALWKESILWHGQQWVDCAVEEETTLFGTDRLDITALVDVLTRCSKQVKSMPRKDRARCALQARNVQQMVEMLVAEVVRRKDFTGRTLPTRTFDRYSSDLTASTPSMEAVRSIV